MVDHYQILGVPQSASADDLKAAFKKLALKYHPDRNPGSDFAEEKFKEINRAYQVLSDPYTRHQYDLARTYSDRRPPPPRSPRQPFYYPPFSRSSSGRPYEYQFGWKYVKSQLAAFAFVFLVALLVFGVKTLYDQYKINKFERLAVIREQFFQQAQAHFDSGQYKQSLEIIMQLYRKNPIEPSIGEYRKKFVSELFHKAETEMQVHQFQSALFNLQLVSEYQRIKNPKVYEMISQCFKALGDYENAVKALDVLLEGDHTNLRLNLEIGTIYLDSLESPDRARPYLDRARVRVKEILTQMYGYAAEIVMDPEDTPPIYYEVFYKRARMNSMLNNYQEALKDCNWSVFLNPQNGHAFFLRGQNYQAIGNAFRACKNWKEADRLGYSEAGVMRARFCN